MNTTAVKLRKGLRTVKLLRQVQACIDRARKQGKDGSTVLVVMLAQMGDVVMGLGVAAALRETRHAASPLLFACQPQWVPLAEGDPLLDGVLAVQSLYEVRALARLFQTVYVLDIPIPSLLHYLDGVPSVFRYSLPTTADWFAQGRHLMDLYAQNAGLLEGSVTPRTFWADTDRPAVSPHNGLTVALHAQSSMAAKNWPLARFAALVRRHPGTHFVLLGAAGEGGELRFLPNVLDLTGQLTLPGTAATIAACDLFIGPDSGPAYIAWAVGTKTLTVYGATVPETSGPRGPGHTHVRAAGACIPACHRACVHTPLCIDSLIVDMVDAALERALRT